MRWRVHVLPKTVISSASNTYAKKSKRLGSSGTASWAALSGHLHILEYLVERKYDKYNEGRVRWQPERPLGLFEVLARNRQGAVGLSSRTRSAQKQPNRVCTLPPREQLSSPRRLVVRKWRVIRIRIRIRIRIIAQVLKLPQPCKYNKRERHETLFIHFVNFFSLL